MVILKISPELQPSQPPPPQFPCPSCTAIFPHPTHLQTHNISLHHSTTSTPTPTSCIFCSQTFHSTQRDLLIRHLRSCQARTVLQTPSSCSTKAYWKQGRKRKRTVCDCCRALKRDCSGTLPCLSCVHRRQNCAYSDERESCAATARRGRDGGDLLAVRRWLEEHLAGGGEVEVEVEGEEGKDERIWSVGLS